MASSVLVGVAAKLDEGVSAVGIRKWKVEFAAGLACEDDIAPAKLAYTVPKINSWRLKRNVEKCMMCNYL